MHITRYIFIHISNYIVKNATGRVILFKHLLILWINKIEMQISLIFLKKCKSTYYASKCFRLFKSLNEITIVTRIYLTYILYLKELLNISAKFSI